MSYKPELQSNNADLLEILNQINAMPEGGGGAGGGSGGSIEGGYDVTFNDENGVTVTFVSVQAGRAVTGVPDYNCDQWRDANGSVVSFPIVPTKDMVVTAYIAADWAGELWTAFGVSGEVYPYITINQFPDSMNQTFFRLYFSKGETVGAVLKGGFIQYKSPDNTMTNSTSLEEFMEWIIANSASFTKEAQNSSGDNYLNTSEGSRYFANYDLIVSGCTTVRIDE